MKRFSVDQLLTFGILVATAVVARLVFQDVPNFAPVAGLALFAGYYFRSRTLAAATPLAVMIISDGVIGYYQPLLMLTVYVMLAWPALLGMYLRRCWTLQAGLPQRAAAMAGLLGSSLVASVAFFLVTNLATWWVTPLYASDARGLWHCYVQALPFFRYTLAGDLVFSTLLFGSFVLLTRPAGQPVAAGQ